QFSSGLPPGRHVVRSPRMKIVQLWSDSPCTGRRATNWTRPAESTERTGTRRTGPARHRDLTVHRARDRFPMGEGVISGDMSSDIDVSSGEVAQNGGA